MTQSLWTRRRLVAGLATLPVTPLLAQTTASLATAFQTAESIRQLHAMVVSWRGEVLRAKAFRGSALDRPINVKSVSKSLISALTGIAIQRGELSSVDQLVTPLLRRTVPRRADRRVRKITVGHLLSMRSGLQDVSGAEYGAWTETTHWIYEALSKPMIADPGTDMLYSTASYHVLGAVLSEVSGKDLHELAQTRLGGPMQVELPPWTRDPQGRYLGGNDMRLSPMAMIRFGEVYRRGGAWDGQRIVTRDWINQSWTRRTASVETGHGYGYGWFIWQAQGHRVVYARGYGGQMIYVVPDLELTVAITSNPGQPATLDGHLGVLNALFADQIVPAVKAMA